MNQPGYSTPQALRQAVTARLRILVRERPGTQLADLQRQFAYDRLLCRVFSADRERWVLKGATAMLARLHGVARHTVDIDLYDRLGDIGEAETELRHAVGIDLGDYFRFALGAGRLMTQAGRALRIPVVAYIGATEFANFRVDLTAGLLVTGSPEDVSPLVPINLPGVLQTPYRVYPLVDHIADKASALFETHVRAGGALEPSTRYRDLLDLVVFAHTADVDADALKTAVRAEFERRGLAVPDRLVVPDNPGWISGYARVARSAPMLAEKDLGAALRTAARLIDPVLTDDAEGRWDSEALVWRLKLRPQ